MVLYIQLSDNKSVFGSLSQAAVVWSESPAERDPFPALSEAFGKFGDIRPEGVVCGLPASSSGNSGNIGIKASWSTVRAAVSMANGLAFAWGVPVASIEVNGKESEAELENKIRSVSLEPGIWVKATYSGEPNITRPKVVRG